MNVLDKYIVTNKCCRAYGQNVWMIGLPDEHGVAVFLNENMRLCIKMSSVRFVEPQYAAGRIVYDGMYKYAIVCVHHARRYYIAKILEGCYAGVQIGKSPWDIVPLKAKVL